MNILLITADQWRGDCLSRLGHNHVMTPHLDALASEGTLFKNHFAQATPCGPSRACLYAGMYMQNHRSLLNGTPLDARFTNIALEARKKNYDPALFGYTDVSLDPREFESGGVVPDGYEGVLPGMTARTPLIGDWKLWLDDLLEKGYDIPDDCWQMFKPVVNYSGSKSKGKTFSPAPFKADDSHTAFLVNKVMDYVSQQQSPEMPPWFIHLSLYSPHPPFVTPAPFHERYDAEKMPLPIRSLTPEKEAAQHPWMQYFVFNQRGMGYTLGADSRNNHMISDDDMRQIRATYYGMMTEVDTHIGRLTDHLKQLDCYDNTLIVFTSDHGEQLGDHWMLSKYGYFDQTFHIPLIVRAPGAGAGSSRHRGAIVDAFTESVDIMPTILESIGMDVPAQCDGVSLLPFCRGKQPDNWRQEYHAEFDLRSPYKIEDDIPLGLEAKKCAVNIISDAHYKYVHFNGLPPLFFDRQKDPNEFHDLSNESEYRELMLEYAQKLLTWRMDHDDPAMTNLHLDETGVVKQIKLK